MVLEVSGSNGDAYANHQDAVIDVKICHSDKLGGRTNGPGGADRFSTGENMSGGAIIGVIIAFIAFFFVLALSRRNGDDDYDEDDVPPPDPDLLAFRAAWQVQQQRGQRGSGVGAGRPGAHRLGMGGVDVEADDNLNDEERRRVRKEMIKSRLYRHKLDGDGDGGVQGLEGIIAAYQRADDGDEDHDEDNDDDGKDEDEDEDDEVQRDEEDGNVNANANSAANDSVRSGAGNGGIYLVDTIRSGLGTAVSTVRSIGVGGGIGGGGGDDDDDGTTVPSECSICLADYQEGDVVVWAKTDRCNHIFHEECIEQWLERHDNCPLCREKILEDDDDSAEA